jgi:hypothetical protein
MRWSTAADGVPCASRQQTPRETFRYFRESLRPSLITGALHAGWVPRIDSARSPREITHRDLVVSGRQGGELDDVRPRFVLTIELTLAGTEEGRRLGFDHEPSIVRVPLDARSDPNDARFGRERGPDGTLECIGCVASM